MNNIFLFVGCSGSGKTTIVESLEKKYGLTSIQSYTTRPKRSQNETGHIFVNDEEFDSLNDIVAYTVFDRYRYCATSQQIDDNDLYVVDPAGVETLKRKYKGNKNIKVIFIYTNWLTRFTRMKHRSKLCGNSWFQATISSLKRILNDFKAFKDYDKNNVNIDLVVNNDKKNIDDVVEHIYQYIASNEKEVM